MMGRRKSEQKGRRDNGIEKKERNEVKCFKTIKKKEKCRTD